MARKHEKKQPTMLSEALGSLPVPDVDAPSVAFGNIDHMPTFDTLPEEFQRGWSRGNEWCDAVSTWFYNGASGSNGKITINGVTYAPHEGIDGTKALRAIKAVLGSWAPKHEHKIAACGYMLQQWFRVERIDNRAA